MDSPRKRGYVVTSRRLSREEKIERAREYNDFCGETVIDPEEFAKQELFDSRVDMKCLACGFEDTIDFEELLEITEGDNEAYPRLHCPRCGRRKLVPKSIHDEEKGTGKKNPNS